MSKEIIFGDPARNKILTGCKKMSDAVGSTLGPFGRNVILKREYNDPHVTKDGVTVANYIRLADELEDIGALMIRHAARKTAANSGDGTTTTTLLAYEMIKKLQANNYKIRDLRVALDNVANKFTEFVEGSAKVDKHFLEIVYVTALIATNGDKEMSDIVTQCYEELGKYTDIIVEDSPNILTSFDIHKGMYFDGGYKAKEFITDPERDIVDLKNTLILITDKKISDDADIYEIAKKALGSKFSLLVIAPEVSGEAMHMLVNTASKTSSKLCVIKSPGVNIRRAEMLEDIAVYTGGQVIKENTGLSIKDWTKDKPLAEYMGKAERIVIRRDSTTIIGGSGEKEAIQSRVKYIEERLAEQTDKLMKQRYEKRASGLTGGVAIMQVGGASDVEVKEKKDRLDDCICAVKSAIAEGITYGGGYMYSKFGKKLTQDYNTELEAPHMREIYKLIGEAMQIPVKTIWEVNGQREIPEDYEKYLEDNDVYDPIMVLKDCINNSTSVAYSVISTSAVVINDAETKEIAGDLPNFDTV